MERKRDKVKGTNKVTPIEVSAMSNKKFDNILMSFLTSLEERGCAVLNPNVRVIQKGGK